MYVLKTETHSFSRQEKTHQFSVAYLVCQLFVIVFFFWSNFAASVQQLSWYSKHQNKYICVHWVQQKSKFFFHLKKTEISKSCHEIMFYTVCTVLYCTHNTVVSGIKYLELSRHIDDNSTAQPSTNVPIFILNKRYRIVWVQGKNNKQTSKKLYAK